MNILHKQLAMISQHRRIVSHTTTLRRSGKPTLAHSHRARESLAKVLFAIAKRADDKVHALSELMFNYIFEKSGTYFSIRSEYVLRSTGSHIASNFYLLLINLHMESEITLRVRPGRHPELNPAPSAPGHPGYILSYRI